MKNVSRPRKTAPRSRCASPAELEEDRRRCLAAKAKPPTPAPTEGNLCACLVTFARWRKCAVCGSETLFVNEQARTDADFECGLCVQVREDLAETLRYVKLAGRVRVRLRSLFTTVNDNGEAHA